MQDSIVESKPGSTLPKRPISFQLITFYGTDTTLPSVIKEAFLTGREVLKEPEISMLSRVAMDKSPRKLSAFLTRFAVISGWPVSIHIFVGQLPEAGHLAKSIWTVPPSRWSAATSPTGTANPVPPSNVKTSSPAASTPRNARLFQREQVRRVSPQVPTAPRSRSRPRAGIRFPARG